MDAANKLCEMCGKRSKHAHHLTGRGPDGEQLHPTVTVDLCHRDHVLIHEHLRNQQVDTPPNEWNVIVQVEYVLRRIAVFLSRCAKADRNSLWSKLAALLESLADDLSRVELSAAGAML